MRWRLRDESREVQICDPFAGGPDGELSPLPREEAATLLRWLAGDPHNADVLRSLQSARRRSQTAPPTSADFFVSAPTPLARTLEEIDRGSLVVFVGQAQVADAEVVEEIIDLEPAPSEPLAPESEPEPEPPPDVVAQAAALRAASRAGSPFCEE